ncbi:MAG: hypothetical protein PHI06_08650 [Desulfobulbaceae bacterium]|nr:hypothetical protein [Desulfobulbaceae bacterium]
MKKTIVVAACFLMLPVAALAASHKASVGPSKAAMSACVGKTAGAAVELTDAKGKMTAATCQEVKGKMVAVPTAQK